MGPTGSAEPEQLLAEQLAYYRALGLDYEDPAIWELGGREVAEALDSFRPTGDVLELACGSGMWTRRLLAHATSVTGVEAAPEMLVVAASRFGDRKVRLIEANLFTWMPDRRYDVVFFAFWLSHVPLERFDSFWSLVADCLEPHGRVFFVDDAYRTPDEVIGGASSSTIRRRLKDGTAYRIVKVPHQPRELEERLGRLGWRVTVTQTSGPLFWGAGRPL